MRRTTAVVLFAAANLCAPAALAQGSSEAPVPDAMGPTGITLNLLSAAGIAGGAALQHYGASGGGPDVCGIDGCFERPGHAERIAGGALIGGSVALGAMSLPVTLVAYLGEQRDRQRRSNGAMTSGIVTTGFGVSLVGMGVGALVEQAQRPQGGRLDWQTLGQYHTQDNRNDATGLAVVSIVSGGVAVAVGTPLWALGAKDETPSEASAPEVAAEEASPHAESVASVRMVTVDNDTAMRNTGIGLTLGGFGHAAAAVSIGFAGLSGCSGDYCGLGTAIMIYFLGIPGAVVGLVGVPLWIAGEWNIEVPSDDQRVREQQANRAVPSVMVGPASVDLGWRF